MTNLTSDSSPFKDSQNDDDLHSLMAVAVLCGHKGVEHDVAPIYEAWAKAYPGDALGGVARGLALIGQGQPREGYLVVEEAARTASTRRQQAQDVLATLKHDISALTE